MKKIKTFEDFKQVDWAKVEFTKFGDLAGDFSKQINKDIFKTDLGFFVVGLTPDEFDNLAKQEYKLKDDIIEVSGVEVLYYDEDGMMLLYKISDDFDKYEIHNNKIILKFKKGEPQIIDFKNPGKKFESNEYTESAPFEEVEKETFLTFEYETIDFPENELKIIQKISPEMKFRLDFYDSKLGIHFVTGYDKKSGKSIIIEKKEDGWYMVFRTESYLNRPKMKTKQYFLCDQFDGLLELLKHSK